MLHKVKSILKNPEHTLCGEYERFHCLVGVGSDHWHTKPTEEETFVPAAVRRNCSKREKSGILWATPGIKKVIYVTCMKRIRYDNEVEWIKKAEIRDRIPGSGRRRKHPNPLQARMRKPSMALHSQLEGFCCCCCCCYCCYCCCCCCRCCCRCWCYCNVPQLNTLPSQKNKTNCTLTLHSIWWELRAWPLSLFFVVVVVVLFCFVLNWFL